MPIKEIEVKARVKDKAALLAVFKKEGIVFGEEIFQEDKVFVNYEGKFKDYPEGAMFLRIRTTPKGIFFTLKKPQGNIKNGLAKIEKELTISDGATMQEICEMLGYREANIVKKKRIKTKIGEYEICIDEVEELGIFIEVEKMSDGNDEAVFEELFTFLEKFGIKREDRVLVGYDVLMAEKLGK